MFCHFVSSALLLPALAGGADASTRTALAPAIKPAHFRKPMSKAFRDAVEPLLNQGVIPNHDALLVLPETLWLRSYERELQPTQRLQRQIGASRSRTSLRD
jgi:hypothetical protein